MGKLILGESDKQLLKQLVEVEKLLIVPEAHKLDLSRGAIVVPCADGDQMDDLFDDIRSLAIESGKKPRPHFLTEHGGAMVLSPEWHDPDRPGRARRLTEDLVDAAKMKDIYTVLLFCHAPCGKATACKVDIEASIRHLMLAKRVVKQLDPQFQVRCFVHIDWHDEFTGNGHFKETYFISAETWDKRNLRRTQPGI
ncbi:MAG: hypothetical protein G01um101413_916 [Parcubacteria group bacterium Gr01-1014_13]|nr:MAG: hypothetical protein G01um101413_916 [Parcubacteria group bacterium Gr01-1014_13]